MGISKLMDKKYILIILLLIFLIVLVIIEPGWKAESSFKIEDKCGRFMNLMSHSIDDESACKLRCASQCDAKDQKYRDVEFKSNEESCNYCMCHCR